MGGNLKLCTKIWLECGGEYAFGSGIAGILKAIRKNGSLAGAAEELGQSYRYLWGRIRKAEKVLGRKLVHTIVGGSGKKRARLTDFGESILGPFMEFENSEKKHADAGFAKMMKRISL